MNKFAELLFALLLWRIYTYSICIVGSNHTAASGLWLVLINFRHRSVI